MVEAATSAWAGAGFPDKRHLAVKRTELDELLAALEPLEQNSTVEGEVAAKVVEGTAPAESVATAGGPIEGDPLGNYDPEVAPATA